MSAEYVLEMRGITKRYGENTVLSNVTLKVKPGEIHALLGENGAGKSTLMNVLFGMPVIHANGGFEGELLLDGQPTKILSPDEAMHNGIGMVHQEFMLLPGFTISENIKLNREITKPNFASRLGLKNLETLDMETMASDARTALDSVGMGINEYTLVKGLPVGYMQFVEIAREIDKKGIKLLVFDEPTAVLTESEAEQLIKVMKQIAATGIAIIFITHRLDEVISAANSITILRDGQLVTSLNTCDTNATELAELMVGRKGDSMVSIPEEERTHKDNVVLTVEHLSVDMPGEEIRDVSFEVYEGEIFGIGGLAGQGKIGIPNGIMGAYPADGKVTFFGKEHLLNNPHAALASGMSMVSEDRRQVGLLLGCSIEDNIVFNAMQIHGEYLKKIGFFTQRDSKAIRAIANEKIKELDIRCTGPLQATGTLSGGNQQKVCIARALLMNPKLLFVSEPTRGIDIGAKKLVLETLVKLNKELGMTIVMVSSELMELRSICGRIAIVSEGKISGILKSSDSAADFGLAMSGMSPTKGGNQQ